MSDRSFVEHARAIAEAINSQSKKEYHVGFAACHGYLSEPALAPVQELVVSPPQVWRKTA